MSANIVDMSWMEVMTRLDRITPLRENFTVYGVPRGGAVVAGLMQAANPGRITAVLNADFADVLLDDIIDTGRTRDRFAVSHPGKSMFALVDKTKEDNGIGWVRFPWEHRDMTSDIEDTVVRQLEAMGEDPTREGLKDTPKRFIKAMFELTEGLRTDPKTLLKTFDEKHDEIVCVRRVNFVSVCEHHLLPFTGEIDFAYIPENKIVGLSKIPRFIQALARRPQVQERLTMQIADQFMDTLSPRGVMVVVRGVHSCMRLRGVRSNGDMVTSVVRGIFKEDPKARAEALSLMQSP